MEQEDAFLDKVIFYALEGQYHHIELIVEELILKFGSSSILMFWKGFIMILEDRFVEGIRDLKAIPEHPTISLSVFLALMYAHHKCKPSDKETVHELESAFKKERKSSSEKSLFYASMVFWLTGRHDRARDYVDKCLKFSYSAKNLALRGWVDLTTGKDAYITQSLKFFDDAYKICESPSLTLILGKAHYYYVKKEYSESLDILNNGLASSWLSITLSLEKLKVQVASEEWDLALETARKCLSLDVHCIKAIQIIALEQCVRQGNMNEVAHTLAKLIEQIDESEPHGYKIYLSSARTFLRLCGSHHLVLRQCLTLLERSYSVKNSIEAITEQAYLNIILGNFSHALSIYKNCLSVDQGNIPALLGMVHCMLKINRTKEATQQLEFLNELQASSKTAYLLFLNALAVETVSDESDFIDCLISALELQFALVKNIPVSMEYYMNLNPDLIVSICEIILSVLQSKPSTTVGQSSNSLQQVLSSLRCLVKSAPGLLHVQLLLARFLFVKGDTVAALSLIQLCIDEGYSVIEALMLQAVIFFHLGDNQHCGQILETALSQSFEIQQCPLFLLIQGQQFYVSGLYKDCITSIQTALSLKNMKRCDLLSPPSLNQLVTGHLTLVHALSNIGLEDEASKAMLDCINGFAGTAEELRVTIASAELLLHQNKSNEALELLKKVTEDKQLFYIQARQKMADIYLTIYKNKHRYIQCHKEIAKKIPGPSTAILLGDALIAVNEVEKALMVFETALKKTPSDGYLVSKVGQCHVKMHNYNKAVSYFEAALKSHEHADLRCELAVLYLRLFKYEQAERTLLLALEQNSSEQTDGIGQIKDKLKFYQLLTNIYCKNNEHLQAIKIFEKGRAYQALLVKQMSVNSPDGVNIGKNWLGNMLHQLAAQLTLADSQNSPKAELLFKEAINNCPDNAKYRESLCRWYLLRGQFDYCEQECFTLLKMDANNNNASFILAEVLYAKGEFFAAIKHFEAFLAKNSTCFDGIAILIDLYRRIGNLQKAHKFIEYAELQTSSMCEPGLSYCKGLLLLYRGKPESALIHFNRARVDSQWGEKSLFCMIEICLNFDWLVGNETLNSDSSDEHHRNNEAALIACKTAEKLLKELIPATCAISLKKKVLENYTLMIGSNRDIIDKALTNFTEMPTNEKENLSSIIGMAVAHLLMKQVTRARNLLKRLAKISWSLKDANELEKGWILLADVYVQTGKSELAVNLLQKCLKYNKSCCKAYEYLGHIAEKDLSYEQAINHYHNAWVYSSMSDPIIGYKLAFNYFRKQSYMKAIDVCHDVLNTHPTYPRIKSDILDKSRVAIRKI